MFIELRGYKEAMSLQAMMITDAPSLISKNAERQHEADVESTGSGAKLPQFKP